MRIAVLQHVDFEGPGEIATWARQQGHAVATHRLHSGDFLPALDTFDLLLVMGGEMNIYQYRDWPWLKPESALIKAALEAGKRAIGICLGAQFIADALGAHVVQNAEVELGWLPITWTPEARAFFPEIASDSIVLHWHGDTYSLPPGAMRLAISNACAEQGFLIPGKCLALQCHLEVDPGIVKEFVAGQGSWPKGPFVQTPDAILAESAHHCDVNRALLHDMLNRFCAS